MPMHYVLSIICFDLYEISPYMNILEFDLLLHPMVDYIISVQQIFSLFCLPPYLQRKSVFLWPTNLGLVIWPALAKGMGEDVM